MVVVPSPFAVRIEPASVEDHARIAELTVSVYVDGRPSDSEYTVELADVAGRANLAELLVNECLERARSAGKRRMVLSTAPAMTAAHRLYERLGFTRLPERDWTPTPGTDLLVYDRALG